MSESTLLMPWEISAITRVLRNEAPDLVSHLEFIEVASREFTGVGLFLNMRYVKQLNVSENHNTTFGQSVLIKLNSRLQAGCIIYIDKDFISVVEFYCHGYENWPDTIEDFEIISR